MRNAIGYKIPYKINSQFVHFLYKKRITKKTKLYCVKRNKISFFLCVRKRKIVNIRK